MHSHVKKNNQKPDEILVKISNYVFELIVFTGNEDTLFQFDSITSPDKFFEHICYDLK